MSRKLAMVIVPLIALSACKGPEQGGEAQAPAFGPPPPKVEEVQIGMPEWDRSAAPAEGVSLEIVPTPVAMCSGAQVVAVHWDLGAGMARPQIWVQGGPARPKLFAAPDGAVGEATTGPWVDQATIFFLVEGDSGKLLGDGGPTPAPCS